MFTRRQFVIRAFGGLAASLVADARSFAAADVRSGAQHAPAAATAEAWMDGWMNERLLVGALHVSRFVEPVYFLTRPIAWKPNAGQAGYEPVVAPRGFVTDFASIPRAFWSLLRPDGEYTYPAILHDYLYWTQPVPKKTADEIFRMGMQDLEVNPATVAMIYEAVAKFGGAAWKANAELKAQGEKRFLRRFPTDPATRWRDWKQLPDVFS